MFSKLGLCVCLAVFAFVASAPSGEHSYLVARSEQLFKSTDGALVAPNVSGNLITRIRQLSKDLRRQTDEYVSAPTYDEFVTTTKLSHSSKVFDSQNSLEQLLDLLKLVQKAGEQSAMQFGQALSKEMHGMKDQTAFKNELKALDGVIGEKHPDYLEWYHESKVIDRVVPLLEIKLALRK